VIAVQPFILAVLILVLLLACITDIRSQKIPNWLTYPIILLAILVYSAVHGLHGFLFSLEGLGLGFAVLIPIYAAGGMGAGDVKLMAAVGAVLGPLNVFYAFLSTAITGGVYAFVILLLRAGRMKDLAVRSCAALKTLILVKDIELPRLDSGAPRLKLYYGAAISLGTLAYIFFAMYTGSIPLSFF
jgi:prepilin peptidase CpaA